MATISYEDYLKLEDLLVKNGYLPYEYIEPEKYVVTSVKCPICGKNVGLYTHGLSHKIECTTDSCLV